MDLLGKAACRPSDTERERTSRRKRIDPVPELPAPTTTTAASVWMQADRGRGVVRRPAWTKVRRLAAVGKLDAEAELILAPAHPAAMKLHADLARIEIGGVGMHS